MNYSLRRFSLSSLVLGILVLLNSFADAAPIITGISPTSVRPGGTVTISGSGFTGITASRVRFNGSSDGTGGIAASLVSGVTDTSITATI
ncbi:MAG: IPT/TIG domain-containing protein, partial [Opitutaceae bacterium]